MSNAMRDLFEKRGEGTPDPDAPATPEDVSKMFGGGAARNEPQEEFTREYRLAAAERLFSRIEALPTPALRNSVDDLWAERTGQKQGLRIQLANMLGGLNAAMELVHGSPKPKNPNLGSDFPPDTPEAILKGTEIAKQTVEELLTNGVPA